MTSGSPSATGYVAIDRRHAGPDALARLGPVLERLAGGGWSRALSVDDMEVWLGSAARLRARQVHLRHILVGDWRGEGESLASQIGQSRSSEEIARRAVRRGWGRYVLMWRDEETRRLAVLRDPSGALDCVWWRFGDLTIVASDPPPELDALLPREARIDWESLETCLETPALVAQRPLIHGFRETPPGALTTTGPRQALIKVWSPRDFASGGNGWNDDPRALAEVVDRTTSALVSDHPRLIVELSGGLDSAVTSAALIASGGVVADFVNYRGGFVEGDERVYAGAVAERLGVTVDWATKPVAPIRSEQWSELGQSLRPGLNGLDVAYDEDMARRVEAAGASAILSGQGGDAVFQYAADPAMAVDRLLRLGPGGLTPAFLTGLAQWTRLSAWSVLRHAASMPQLRSSAASILQGRALTGPGPAKAGQLQAYANAQLFWGDCLRTRRAEILQPLLAQPVVEHCLSIPVDVLTRGSRDRALARAAFKDRLPSLVLERRGKGDLTQHYARVVRASLPELRPFLLEGQLASHRLIDVAALDQALTETALIRRPAANRPLILAVFEAWLRGWTARLGRRQ